MKTFEGTVVSVKTPKTAIIEIVSYFKHRLYKKTIFKSKRLAVHFENMTVSEGNKVIISETRPISKTKHFRITKVI